MHSAEPAPADVPAVHESGCVAPSGQKFPGGHSAQAVWSEAPSFELYVRALHLVGWAEPSGQKPPRGHGTQLEESRAPSLGLCFPAGQGVASLGAAVPSTFGSFGLPPRQ